MPSSQSTPVVVATTLRPRGGTGVQTHFNEFLRYLASRATPGSLVTPFSAGGVVRDGVFALRRLIEPWNGSASVWWYRHWHGYFLERALRHHLAAYDEVIVYCQCPVAADAALRARRDTRQRVVMAVHFCVSQADEWAGKGAISRGDRIFDAIRALEERVLRTVDGIVFVSQSARSDLWLDDFGDVPSAIVPNFVAPSGPGPVPGHGADLVTVGSLEARKNQRFLLEAVADAARRGHCFTLDIVGDGPDRRALAKHIEVLGIGGQVRLLGYVPEAGRLLSGYRAYVHPATSEVLPLAVIEAMSAGLPVVAAPVGGIPELLRDGQEGRFLPLDSSGAAAQVLIDVLGDEAVRLRMGAASRDRFLACHDATVVGSRLHDFLESTPAAPKPVGVSQR